MNNIPLKKCVSNTTQKHPMEGNLVFKRFNDGNVHSCDLFWVGVGVLDPKMETSNILH